MWKICIPRIALRLVPWNMPEQLIRTCRDLKYTPTTTCMNFRDKYRFLKLHPWGKIYPYFHAFVIYTSAARGLIECPILFAGEKKICFSDI